MSVVLSNIELLRTNLINNINNLMTNRHMLKPEEYTSLINYHRISLNILDNMRNIKIVENNNPNVPKNTLARKLDTSPYYDDIRQSYKPPKTSSSWESQFDTKIINPRIYSLPPTSVWTIKPPKQEEL